MGWPNYKLREWMGIDEMLLNMNLKTIEPEVDTELAKYAQKALALLSVGRPAYGNLNLKVATITQEHPEGEGPPMIAVVANLTSVYFSHISIEGPGEMKMEQPRYQQTVVTYPLFLSRPLSFPKDQIELFRRSIDELYWFEETLTNPVLHKTDVDRLSVEKTEREHWMEETFGPFPIGPVGPNRRRYSIHGWFDDE